MTRQELAKKNWKVLGVSLVMALMWGYRSARGNPNLGTPQGNAVLSGIAVQEGIDENPFPHLRGTAPLIIPKGVPRPQALRFPAYGSIFVVQLNEEMAYWQRRVAATEELRDKAWKPDFASVDAYMRANEAHRRDLWNMLGLVKDGAIRVKRVEVLVREPIEIEDVDLELQDGFDARALLFLPAENPRGAVIAVPDAMESREEFAGIGVEQQPAAWLEDLLRKGLLVCVPNTIERKNDYPLGESLKAVFQLDRRMLLYRLGFIVGRTLVGMEVQQALMLRDYLVSRYSFPKGRVALLGFGQGGMTALYATAIDGDFWGAGVVDYFQRREQCWKEPVDRMLYGQLNEFGDAEVSALVAPRLLMVDYTRGGPTPAASVRSEIDRARRFYGGLGKNADIVTGEKATPEAALADAASHIAARLGSRTLRTPSMSIEFRASKEEIEESRNEHFEKWHQYLRELDRESGRVRALHWHLLSTPPSQRAEKVKEMQRELGDLIGRIPVGDTPLRPRTRLIQVTDKFTAYEVLLNVLPEVHAYGQLLVPRNHQGKQLPVVICQHGLGGTPADITGVGSPNPVNAVIYHALGAHLADLGYVVFAPYLTVPVREEVLENPLVRMAATVGMMRTSLELAKLHRIVDFLQTLSFVDAGHIGYYGLSYGGYSAEWMTPLEPRIRAIVISGNFNDWREKLTYERPVMFEQATGQSHLMNISYLLYPYDDMYNWNVLNRFTALELEASKWPRGVCIEYGTHDSTTTPEWHRRAWNQIRALKAAWGLGGLQAEMVQVHYDGVHEIHGIVTFDFLKRWLRPEESGGRDLRYSLLPMGLELHLEKGSLGGEPGFSSGRSVVPLVRHTVDERWTNRIEGRFYVSSRSPVFTGMAFQLSRVGHPGDLIVRWGSAEDSTDIGIAHVLASRMDPPYPLWYEAKVTPIRLDPTKLYYFEITAENGQAPEDYYLAYGPQPLGGKDMNPHFGLSYRVLSANNSSFERFNHSIQ